MPPEQVGFVMEGTRAIPVETKPINAARPQPAHANNQCYPAHASPATQQGNWSPYYPQVVMLPSGLMQVQQPATPGWNPQLCGYNRFPVVWNFGPGVIAIGESRSELVQTTLEQSPGRRILPPTWENSVHSCSPFLAPYPVAVLAQSTDHFAHDHSEEVVKEKKPAPRIDPVKYSVASNERNHASSTEQFNYYAQPRSLAHGHHAKGYNPQWNGMVMPCWVPVHPTHPLHMQYIRPGLILSETRESPLMYPHVL